MMKTIVYPYLHLSVNQFILQSENDSVWVEGGLYTPWDAYGELVGDRSIHLLSTHGHWDHIGMNHQVQQHGGTVYAHPGDKPYYEQHDWHWQVLFGQFEKDVTVPPERVEVVAKRIGQPSSIDCALTDKQELNIGPFCFEVLHTPGHSNGSVCYLEKNEGLLFTGDSLMGNGFFGGTPQYCHYEQYVASMERLSQLKAEWVYPAHGEPLEGSGLKARAQEGIACAQRIDAAVKRYVQTHSAIHLGEAVDFAAASENKGSGAGLCVTVLAHLNSMGIAPEEYIYGI